MVKLKNCNFDTWSSNHSPEHKDRIFRELYPFRIFEKIDFSEHLINKEQSIEFNGVKYFVELLKIELQKNGRYRTTFNLSTVQKSNRQKWVKRKWDEKFQIIYSQTFFFITVFTKNEDSSKKILKRFFKGNFEKIYKNRSLPISDLLFRTLVLNLSEDMFGEGKHYQEFKFIDDGIVDNEEHDQFKNNKSKFSPLFSQGRELWVCHAFNEEKANKIGFFNGNQAKKLFVTYCNPTYTRHHRCNYKNVEILSLFEFAFKNSKRVYGNYDEQIRLLQNHLNKQETYSTDELLQEIKIPNPKEYDIYKSELMEALGIMKIVPRNSSDLFLYLSAMNLLNAWINRKRKEKDKKKLFRDMYSFKKYIANTVTHLLKNGNLGAEIYIEPNLLIIEHANFQFSFHNVPINQTLQNYLNSDRNKEIIWNGKRLQPILSLIFKYAKKLNKEALA